MFIVAVTLVFFGLVFYVVFWLFTIILMIVIIWFFLAMLSSEGKNTSEPETTPIFPEKRYEAILDDGTKLTKGHYDTYWKDGMGNSYAEEQEGVFRKR